MVARCTRKSLSVALSVILVAASLQTLYGYQTAVSTPTAGAGGSTDAAPMSASELDALVAPIALYPDALVAQVLSAATFPDQVAIASYWLGQHKGLTGKDLAKEVNKQSWDPSIKALTNFPSVLDNMAKNLSWTSELGEAYHNQAKEVMAAVQTLRAQAKAKGTLKSTPQITVVQQAPDTIVIEPANPQIVYVPQYNPTVIYGTPYVVPGYTAGDVAAAGVIGFGAGIAMGALMAGGSSWGWSSWGCDWHGGVAVYNHAAFYGNAAWHGGYGYGGYHGYGYHGYGYGHDGGYGYHGYDNAYNRSNINRNVNVNNVNKQDWAHDDSGAGRSNAFSGMDGHSGDSFGHSGGWSSRAESGRGWGSMRSGGFGGGRFGGGGFGGGHFGGGRR